MPIIKSDEDFDWGTRICASPSVWVSPKEFEMRKLLIVDTAIDELPVAQTESEVSEGEKRAAYEKAKAEKKMKEDISAQFDVEGHPEVRLVKSKNKTPVFQDLQKQSEICNKFSWVIPGTFTQDPEKSGGTLLNIKCQSCGASRNIHLADAFHTKFCKECRKTKKSNA